jgi:hypothetical protein
MISNMAKDAKRVSKPYSITLYTHAALSDNWPLPLFRTRPHPLFRACAHAPPSPLSLFRARACAPPLFLSLAPTPTPTLSFAPPPTSLPLPLAPRPSLSRLSTIRSTRRHGTSCHNGEWLAGGLTFLLIWRRSVILIIALFRCCRPSCSQNLHMGYWNRSAWATMRGGEEKSTASQRHTGSHVIKDEEMITIEQKKSI